MSERRPHSLESLGGQTHEHHKQQEALKIKVEQGKKATNEHAERLDDIRKETESTATSAKESLRRQLEDDSPSKAEKPVYVNRELKNIAYQRTLKRTRQHLSTPSRAFSKIIHQPSVEAVSEFAANTVARPSGILAGGVAAFLGSSLFLWISRHYGYEYNFLLFALFFVGGFFIGLLVEIGLRLASKR